MRLYVDLLILFTPDLLTATATIVTEAQPLSNMILRYRPSSRTTRSRAPLYLTPSPYSQKRPSCSLRLSSTASKTRGGPFTHTSAAPPPQLGRAPARRLRTSRRPKSHARKSADCAERREREREQQHWESAAVAGVLEVCRRIDPVTDRVAKPLSPRWLLWGRSGGRGRESGVGTE